MGLIGWEGGDLSPEVARPGLGPVTSRNSGHTILHPILKKEQMVCDEQAYRGLTKGSAGKCLAKINIQCPEGVSSKFR